MGLVVLALVALGVVGTWSVASSSRGPGGMLIWLIVLTLLITGVIVAASRKPAGPPAQAPGGPAPISPPERASGSPLPPTQRSPDRGAAVAAGVAGTVGGVAAGVLGGLAVGILIAGLVVVSIVSTILGAVGNCCKGGSFH
jgi:hypothetical protein